MWASRHRLQEYLETPVATVVPFHSALGRRPAVNSFADQLHAAGHEVHIRDLHDGEVFDDLHAGAAERDALGVPVLLDRAHRAVADLPAAPVYAGFSMGAAAAQALAATRPGTSGAILIQGAVPLDTLGLDAWPSGVPVSRPLRERRTPRQRRRVDRP